MKKYSRFYYLSATPMRTPIRSRAHSECGCPTGTQQWRSLHNASLQSQTKRAHIWTA